MGLIILVIVIIAIALWLKKEKKSGNDLVEIESAILSHDIGGMDWDELEAFLQSKGISEETYQSIRLDAHKKRAESGDTESQYWYALLNDAGNGDKEEAERYYNIAANKGYIPAITRLMYAYTENGTFGHKTDKELYWTKKGAEMEDVSAMLKLALDYGIGEIIEKNEDEEEKWLLKAASKGSSEAYTRLSGLTKYICDHQKRIQWLRRAVELASENNDRDAFESASNALGWLYKPYEKNPVSDSKKSCYFFALSYILGNSYSGEESRKSGYVPEEEEFKSWVNDAKNLMIRM